MSSVNLAVLAPSFLPLFLVRGRGILRTSQARSSKKFAASFAGWHHAHMRSAEMSRAQVNGYSVAYQEAGEGPPLVLLHGFLCDSRCWRRQLEDLSDSFRVVAWDAPGAGSSSDPPAPFTITDWTQCLAQFLDVVGIERAHVLGLSWGGVLAQEFYRYYPDRVLGLILADTYAGWKGSHPEEACNKLLQRCFVESRACYELGQKSHRNADFTGSLVPSRSLFPAFLSRF
jgi:pimeloyl-ACP methyl ester carboxylesterase